MNATKSAPWTTRLSQAIAGFPLWGRLRPHTQRGHAITALAFHAWAKGGLGLFSYTTETKAGGRHLYACAFSPSRFEPLLVDWEKGWCSTERESSKRFQADASRHGTVYSWTFGPLPSEQGSKELMALSPQDQALVVAMQMHLETELGPFDWELWKTAGIDAVEPTSVGDGSYLLPNKDPLSPSEPWPPGLDADVLCDYLSPYPRVDRNKVDFFHFQERLDAYMANNPSCLWESAHSQKLLERFAGTSRVGQKENAARYFHLEDMENIWPIRCTRVIAPHFSEYLRDFIGVQSGYRADEEADSAWFAASHAVPDLEAFDMYAHVFQGKAVLDGTEQLSLAGVKFGVSANRGEKGVLLRIDTSLGEDAVLDVLRQARAYCGGILAVDAALVASNRVFWEGVFARREVAALLDEYQQPICQHPHFSYMRSPVSFPYPTVDTNPSAIAEYSLFQTDARGFRRSKYSCLLGCWGWKHVLDCLGTKHDWCPPFPCIDAWPSYEKKERWLKLRERWFETMPASAAALVLNKLAQRSDWPVDLNTEAKNIADHYLAQTPLHAVCEMMGFDATGVLAVLRQHQRGLTPAEDLVIDSTAFSIVLGDEA